MNSESSRTKRKTLTWDSSMALLSPTCEDIFSNDVIKQHNITELYNQFLEIRELL